MSDTKKDKRPTQLNIAMLPLSAAARTQITVSSRVALHTRARITVNHVHARRAVRARRVGAAVHRWNTSEHTQVRRHTIDITRRMSYKLTSSAVDPHKTERTRAIMAIHPIHTSCAIPARRASTVVDV